MNLSVQDATLFHELHLSLLAFVNRQLRILPRVKIGRDLADHPAAEIARVRDALLEHPDLLDRFVAENPEHLPADKLAIVAAWKQGIAGDFMVVRHLKAYTVFLSTASPSHLYGVLGLYDPLEELLGGVSSPLYVKAVLLPFQGRIVYDGLMTVHSIYFGPGVRSSCNEQYNELKGREGIIEQIVDSEGQPHIATSLAHQKPRKPAPDWRPLVDEFAAKTDKMRQSDNRLQGAALDLLRASARLAQVTFGESEQDLDKSLRQVRTALTKLHRQVGT